MDMLVSSRVLAVFLRVLKARVAIVAVFATLTVAGIHGAAHIPTDSSIDRLVVAGDPVATATRDFEKLFPEGEQALLMLEASNPFAPAVLQRAAELEGQLTRSRGSRRTAC